MLTSPITLHLPTPEDTDKLGQSLARFARRGDCILLRGNIGAGKSAVARAFIHELLGSHTEVPSPTFTLVQVYDSAKGEIWHADLYRLSDTSEAIELGLIEAFDDAITLIEWPEILGDMVPKGALDIHLEAGPNGHLATLTFLENWSTRLEVAP